MAFSMKDSCRTQRYGHFESSHPKKEITSPVRKCLRKQPFGYFDSPRPKPSSKFAHKNCNVSLQSNEYTSRSFKNAVTETKPKWNSSTKVNQPSTRINRIAPKRLTFKSPSPKRQNKVTQEHSSKKSRIPTPKQSTTASRPESPLKKSASKIPRPIGKKLECSMRRLSLDKQCVENVITRRLSFKSTPPGSRASLPESLPARCHQPLRASYIPPIEAALRLDDLDLDLFHSPVISKHNLSPLLLGDQAASQSLADFNTFMKFSKRRRLEEKFERACDEATKLSQRIETVQARYRAAVTQLDPAEWAVSGRPMLQPLKLFLATMRDARDAYVTYAISVQQEIEEDEESDSDAGSV